MNRWAFIAALALPVAGLATGIALNETRLQDSTTWRIPVEGYDPRDLLRGRYIQFRYAWKVEGPARLCASGNCVLCLEDAGKAVRVEPRPGVCEARVDPHASSMHLMSAPEIDGRRLAATSRIFVSEASAPKLETQLRAGPMVVVARLTRDGRLVNERLEKDRR